jgi:hypothetical protein
LLLVEVQVVVHKIPLAAGVAAQVDCVQALL